MFLDSVGIILKKNELSPHKIIILDKMQGKIECVSPTLSLSVGALVTYNIKKQGIMHFISNTTLIYIPITLAQTDMLFFHHVLELIYYFTSMEIHSPEVFDLLSFLYSNEHIATAPQSKKIFLLKLLTSMGSVPEINKTRTDYIAHLAITDIQQLNTITIALSHEKELDRWLWCCVWQHPYVKEFKTVHFLAKNRAL